MKIVRIMKMKTLNFTSNRLHSISADSQLSLSFSNDKPLYIDVSAMASGMIERDCMKCFYTQYSNLGGKSLPREIVNMVIQQVTLPQKVLCQNSIKMAIFVDIAKRIAAMQIKNNKDIWRLSCIVSEQEYDYVINYRKWFLHKLF